MNLELKLKLQKKITEWANENCEESIWPDHYVGENLENFMTEAASSVFDAMMDIQEYLEREGDLK